MAAEAVLVVKGDDGRPRDHSRDAREFYRGCRAFYAGLHDLFAAPADADQFILDALVILGHQDSVAPGLKSNLLRAGARYDHPVVALDRHLDLGVVHFHHQRAVGI